MSCSFLDLPNELIADIVEYIDDLETLRALARTCSRLQIITEQRLYQSIFHRTGEAAIDLCKAIDARPGRADAIQIIESRCKWQKRAGLVSLAPVISQARNLRELMIESPYCNNAYGKEVELWRRTMSCLLRPICSIGLSQHSSQLKRLTLHLTGSERYWNIDSELSMIFRHPSLSSLTISCAEIHEDYLQPVKGAAQTPLKRLVLMECNLTVEALGIMLSLPQALEELHLGENCYHKWLNSPQFRVDRPRYVNQLCSSDPETFFLSLSQQKHALEVLTYTVKGPSLGQVVFPETCRGLSDFRQLRHVTLDGYCPYFEQALMLGRTAPSTLCSLEAKGDMFRLQCNPGLSLADDYQSQVRWTIAATAASTHLRNVRLVSNRTFTNVSRNHREAVEQLGQAFRDRKVSMQLFKRTFHRHIPPFLYGEQEPTEELVYDTEVGFCQELKPSCDRALNDIDF